MLWSGPASTSRTGWEYADLCAALEVPVAVDAAPPNGLVVLDALLSTHTIRWHPFRLRPGPDRGDGTPTVVPEWGSAVRHPGGALPAPVGQLLEVWREWRRDDVARTRAELESAGFLITWAAGLTQAR